MKHLFFAALDQVQKAVVEANRSEGPPVVGVSIFASDQDLPSARDW